MNNDNRPSFKTNYNNVFISGAHCNTGVSVWLMESATESGKRCAIEIMKKLNLKNKIKLSKHNRPMKTIYWIDDILYKLKLPNMTDIISIIILIGILYLIVIIIKKISTLD